MQSVSLNNYNAGAATTVGGGVAGGGMLGHTEYPITNGEWMLNGSDDTLCVYLSMRHAVDVDKLKPNL